MNKRIYKQFLRRFANGEQYLYIDACGEIAETEKDYFWQERCVYNHILPLLESRREKFILYCAKDADVNPADYLKNFDEQELFAVVERCLAVQRCYNAIKNRKLELINRLSHGVLAVEDGSVDVDNLSEEGLCPGKIVVYRQGSTPPHLLMQENNNLYESLSNEEDRLLSEFTKLLNQSDLYRYFDAVIQTKGR